MACFTELNARASFNSLGDRSQGSYKVWSSSVSFMLLFIVSVNIPLTNTTICSGAEPFV